MLSKILTKDECAGCKFCCSFVRTSIWEAPLFSKKQKRILAKKYPAIQLKPYKDVYTINFDGAYKTDDPKEEVACPFLDSHKGCILNDKEKPFDCKIWPLRIMNKDEQLVIAKTPTCPSVNKYSDEQMIQFVNTEKVGKKIYKQSKKMPYMIKEYREDFPILMERQP